mmetsp:Transcript_30512/g.99173  ORF Transcript_30512/g.99173 Transcript_30512/m.99173 type:complete len:378 (+) Transcript_30512:1210-2343(+)
MAACGGEIGRKAREASAAALAPAVSGGAIGEEDGHNLLLASRGCPVESGAAAAVGQVEVDARSCERSNPFREAEGCNHVQGGVSTLGTERAESSRRGVLLEPLLEQGGERFHDDEVLGVVQASDAREGGALDPRRVHRPHPGALSLHTAETRAAGAAATAATPVAATAQHRHQMQVKTAVAHHRKLLRMLLWGFGVGLTKLKLPLRTAHNGMRSERNVECNDSWIVWGRIAPEHIRGDALRRHSPLSKMAPQRRCFRHKAVHNPHDEELGATRIVVPSWREVFDVEKGVRSGRRRRSTWSTEELPFRVHIRATIRRSLAHRKVLDVRPRNREMLRASGVLHTASSSNRRRAQKVRVNFGALRIARVRSSQQRWTQRP